MTQTPKRFGRALWWLEQGGLRFAGHDASYTYWTSNPHKAIYFGCFSTAVFEARRSGVTQASLKKLNIKWGRL